MSASSPVWITGAGGLIGAAAVRAAPRGRTVLPLVRGDLDLLDAEAVRRRFEQDRPGAIIHCAALSRTPDCEADPALAWRANVEATARLVSLDSGVPLVFLSTDLVFDGRQGGYRETDPTAPLGVYGRTKVAAEEAVLAAPRGLVLRTSLNYGRSPTGDRSFNEAMENRWRAGLGTTLYADEFRSPVGASETARAIWDLLALGASGVFHAGGSERLSRLEIGRLVAERRPELRPQIIAGSLTSAAGPPRAPDTSMDVSKLAARLGRPMPAFGAWLRSLPAEE